MVKNVKRFLKKNILGIIIGGLIFGTAGVYAATYFPSDDVTYDNSVSGLSSTDVQGAIDELYNVCKAPAMGGDGILEDVPIVTSGDGLYKDEYEDRYFYKGTNPNNYITFNGEKAGWRIISIEYDGTIKIMKDTELEAMTWDDANTQNWTSPASLNTYLNSTYINTLRTTAQKQITIGNFSIGTVTERNNDLATQINNENSTRWQGKIALPTLSEYLRANSDKNNCGTWYKLNNNCAKTNWMYYPNSDWWTLTETKEKNSQYGAVHIVLGNDELDGVGSINSDRVTRYHYVRPTLYLSSDIKITGGDGSKNNPFVIE